MVKRIDCLGDNLEIEECFPVIKRRKAFEKKYSQGQLLEQDWDEMKRELQKLTKVWRRTR